MRLYVCRLKVKAAVSARASSWKESHQPSLVGRHHGYAPPHAVVVTARHRDTHAKDATAVRVTVWSTRLPADRPAWLVNVSVYRPRSAFTDILNHDTIFAVSLGIFPVENGALFVQKWRKLGFSVGVRVDVRVPRSQLISGPMGSSHYARTRVETRCHPFYWMYDSKKLQHSVILLWMRYRYCITWMFLGFVKFRLSAVIKLVDNNDGVHTAHAGADPCVVWTTSVLSATTDTHIYAPTRAFCAWCKRSFTSISSLLLSSSLPIALCACFSDSQCTQCTRAYDNWRVLTFTKIKWKFRVHV